MCSLSEIMSLMWETAMVCSAEVAKDDTHVWAERNHMDEWTSELALVSRYPGETVWRNFLILFFCCLICILLINVIRMIYICYIINKGKVWLCMLTVRDNELNVGNSDSVSCRGCQRWWYTRAWDWEKSCGWVNWWAGSSFWMPLKTMWRNFLILFLCCFICILLINAIWIIYICYIINKGKV